MKTIPFSQGNIEEIVTTLANSKAVIMPTDTIYGIHLPFNHANLAKINYIKQRPTDQPCNALYANIDEISQYMTESEQETLVTLHDIPGLTTIVSGETPTGQAFRRISPSFQHLHDIIVKSGPLFSTSANVSGETYRDDFDAISQNFDPVVNLGCFISNTKKDEQDVSRETNTIASTIVDIRKGRLKLVRQGLVSYETIQELMAKN